jgi:uncharacterized protein YukE
MRAFNKALSYVLLLALVAFPIVVYFNAQAMSDWWQLRGYIAPTDVVKLASQDTMTDYSRHVFYVNHPSLESNLQQFRSDCNEDEKTIVLGCYHSNQLGIFLYNVDEPRLEGVEQVTAAHEMLHAAYDRLNSKEKSHVDNLLEDYFKNSLHDPRIIASIKSYQQSEPKELVNEMHSIFGTEITKLPASLEQYYSKYFTNRHAVTDFADAYQKEFNRREAIIKADDGRLAQLKIQIGSEEQSLQAQLAQINADRDRLDSLRSSRNPAEYNAAVARFNNEVNAYNSGVDSLHANIAAYNRLVAERNTIATELANLAQALDTRLTTQTTQ